MIDDIITKHRAEYIKSMDTVAKPLDKSLVAFVVELKLILILVPYLKLLKGVLLWYHIK